MVHVLDGRTLLHDLFAIHVRIQLGHAGKRGGAEPRKFRAFPRLGEKGLEVRRKKVEVFASPILQHECESTRRSNARDGWKREGKSYAFGEREKLLVDSLLDGVKLLFT